MLVRRVASLSAVTEVKRRSATTISKQISGFFSHNSLCQKGYYVSLVLRQIVLVVQGQLGCGLFDQKGNLLRSIGN